MFGLNKRITLQISRDSGGIEEAPVPGVGICLVLVSGKVDGLSCFLSCVGTLD